ncbi:Uncharacterised protein [Vibrio cholerae]|nr:Uncharacterised protein [Vibrio cholerae]
MHGQATRSRLRSTVTLLSLCAVHSSAKLVSFFVYRVLAAFHDEAPIDRFATALPRSSGRLFHPNPLVQPEKSALVIGVQARGYQAQGH